MYLTFKYTVFAGVATTLNIVAQDVTVRLYAGPMWLYASMAVGTLTGLLVKYFLDKRYIFFYASKNLVEDGRKFVLYSFMGIGTTLIFWGAELFFEYVFHSRVMRYSGGIIGLFLGYWVKYHLDKRFVFVRRNYGTKRVPEAHASKVGFSSGRN
jgi:putative flippase GtrA